MATAKAIKTSAGKETASQTVARAKSMLAQTKAEGSTAYKGSSAEKAYNATKAITPDALATVPTPNIPVPQVKPFTDPIVPSITPQMQDIGYSVQNNQYVYDPKKTEAENAVAESTQKQAQSMQSYISNLMGIKPQSLEQDYLKAEKQAGIQKMQGEVGKYTSQLNNIIATRDANVLRTEGQGRGIPDVIIGGQQAQIQKEAAISALPVQAALEAAQGNLQMAQQRLDKLFTIHREDIQNDFNFKKSLIESVREFATTSENNALNAKLSSIKDKTAEKNQNISMMQQWAQMAIETGQSNLISAFTSLDPNSPTFLQDIGRLQSQVRKPVAVGSSKRDTQVVDGKLIDMQTGQVIATLGGGGDGTLVKVTPKEIQNINDTQIATNSLVSLADSMIQSIKDHGTKVFWGEEAGKRSGAKTNLLLAMKNLEKTGALDKGTIDVLAGTIPGNDFFATEAAQVAALQQLKDTVLNKTNEFVGSYRGTTAEIDPRTKRIYEEPATPSLLQPQDLMDIEKILGGTSTTGGNFNPASFY